jgi:hypothetical protein
MAGPSPQKKKQDVKALLAGAKRAIRRVPICTRADLQDEYETLLAKQQAAQKDDGSASLAGPPAEFAARLDELREEMREATLEFVIRGLPRRKFTELVQANPAREGDKADALLGFNVDEVVEQLIRQGTESPVLDADDWQTLLGDTLTDAQYEQLTNAAWAVNKRDVTVPF